MQVTANSLTGQEARDRVDEAVEVASEQWPTIHLPARTSSTLYHFSTTLSRPLKV